ncbi:MAG TPA: hypothetical protein VEK79_15310 [Thermoanaerobaculia bacterium]|nr:hypothetical protein [Thermoanaerobaculia bacterium]
MIVILETNFILELVGQQDQSAACEELLALADSAAIQLSIPAFSVIEAGMKLERNRRERRNFVQQDVTKHARDSGNRGILRRFETAIHGLETEFARADSDEASRCSIFV